MRNYTQNIYSLPLEKNKIQKIFLEAPTHKVWTNPDTQEINDETNAIDFVCQEGTPIRATLSGKVIYVVNGVTANWKNLRELPPESFMRYTETSGNMVLLEHKNKEVSWYCHLQKNSMKTKIGNIIKTGEIVGLCGNTGISLGPHLHFQVTKLINEKKDMSYKSLIVKWDNQKTINKYLEKLGKE